MLVKMLVKLNDTIADHRNIVSQKRRIKTYGLSITYHNIHNVFKIWNFPFISVSLIYDNCEVAIKCVYNLQNK